ncbi:hypothetical protein BV898_03677 [Hypsibius exemplaris]|uniref:Uncharacterized protein n=1 Tax=Hypsibius exemplaris TaxID=2072580 RepID=A0A1W0X4W5_HYPEX|nr:hypothetical protein BV898_03677 [Hypsibius exemplaris]
MAVRLGVNCAVIGCLVVVMMTLSVECADICDRETIRNHMRHCTNIYLKKRSVQMEVDKTIMGRLRTAHNPVVCQPIQTHELEEYDDKEPDELIQKIIAEYRKEKEMAQWSEIYRRWPRHIPPSRRGGSAHICDIQALRDKCMSKK